MLNLDLSDSFACKILKMDPSQSMSMDNSQDVEQDRVLGIKEFKELYNSDFVIKQLVVAALEQRQVIPPTVIKSASPKNQGEVS